MVLFRVGRVKSARLDDKRCYHRRELPIRPQQPDPSELPLRDHNTTPRKSMLNGAKFGHNIYLPLPRRLKRAARINEKFQRYENKFASDPRISDDRREISIGHEFFRST